MSLKLPALLSLLSLVLLAPVMATAADDDAFAFDDEEELGLDSLDRGGVQGADDKKKKGKDEAPAAPILDDDEPLEEFEFDEPEDDMLGDFEGLEDEPLEDFDTKATKSTSSRMPGAITLDVAGKEPLADNYPLSIVAIDRDAVVVELPVLLARSRVGVEQPFLVIGEVYVGKTKVGEVRQTVEKESLAEFGPSFAWMKVLAPVVEKQGEIKLVVKKANVDGTGATELFTRVTPYALP